MEAAHIWDSHQCLFWLPQDTAGSDGVRTEAMAIAFDLGLPTFRHEADDTYKQTDQAHRKTSFPI